MFFIFLHIFQQVKLYVKIPKTYDRIHKENLVNKMKEFHFQHKLIKLAKVSVVEIFVKVKIGSIE